MVILAHSVLPDKTARGRSHRAEAGGSRSMPAGRRRVGGSRLAYDRAGHRLERSAS